MKKSFKIILLFLLMPAVLLAENPMGKFTKQKNIRKAYIVNADAGIDISNSYGSIYVTTWDEDKVELDILIKVSGDNEEWANTRLNDIDVEINALKNLISARTIIGNTKNKSGRNNSIEINYTIKIPKKGAVKLTNKYGNIVTTDLWGNANVNCKYGNVTLGKLNSATNSINIEYANNTDIEFIKTGNINSKYSKVSIGSFDKIDFNSSYTDWNAQKGDILKYDSNYGKIKLGAIDYVTANGNYLGVVIDQIGKLLTLSTNYSSLKVNNVSANSGDITINSGYTQVSIGYSPSYDFDFDVSVRYGNFKYENDLQINSRLDTSSEKKYKGFSGKSGSNKVQINSNYGNITLFKNN